MMVELEDEVAHRSLAIRARRSLSIEHFPRQQRKARLQPQQEDEDLTNLPTRRQEESKKIYCCIC